MDMIKLDDLKAYRDNRIASGNADFDEMDRLSAFIANVETIEPKRGEWIVYEGEWKDFDYYPPKCKCNQCGYEEDLYILNAKPTNFCPNCGASMGERKESE